MLLLLTASFPVFAAGEKKTTSKDPAKPAWAIPEYGEKAYNFMTETMGGYDPLAPNATELTATAAVLMEAKSGRVLYESASTEPRYPASMTKLMTLIVTLDAIEKGEVSLDDKVSFSEKAVAEDGTKTGYTAGATDSLRHCLEMIMVFSANDAAYAIAEHVGGSVPAFVERMNDKAKEIGMEHTKFVNPNGLPDDKHVTTAYDMAVLGRYCTGREDVMAYTSLKSTEMEKFGTIYNSNKLLFWTEGTDGLKTGTTTAAGHCLTATAVRDDMRLIAVVMGCKKDFTHYTDAMKLLEYGFANYSLVTAVEKGEAMGKANVLYGKEDKVSLVAAEDIAFPVKNGEAAEPEIQKEIVDVEGPADIGADGGDVIVTVNGAEMGRCDLVTTEKIHKRGLFLWLKDFFSALIAGV